MSDAFLRDASPLPKRNKVLQELRDWVKCHAGIVFSPDQDALFAERMASLVRELDLTIEQLQLKLTAGDRTVALRLLEAASTNYTFFFREPEIFEYLRREVCPSLPSGPLRFWSAATSSGDEAYSLAMVSCEFFGAEARERVRILGTDISGRQLRIAEHGSYPRDQLSQLSQPRLSRWFAAAGRGQLRIAEPLREMCTFRRMNLMQASWPFEQRFHVIFLRNVLYYFEPEARRRMLEACFDAAEPGATLITSLTEPMIDVSTRWIPVQPAIFRKPKS